MRGNLLPLCSTHVSSTENESAIYNERMKRLLWTTAVLTTALATPLSSHAEQNKETNSSRVNRQAVPSQTLPSTQPTDAVKVGEYQSSAKTKASDTVIAKIQPHELAADSGQAATLYVRNIPVLTFLSSRPVATSSNKIEATETSSVQTKVATTGNLLTSGETDNDFQTNNSSVWRATAVAARLNSLSLDNVDASKITVSWKGSSNSTSKSDRYAIKVNGEELVEINAETRLPDTTNNYEKDALQATNRLRRLLGNAPPLREVSGKPLPLPKLPQVVLPKLPKKISVGPVQIVLNGWASWYGPGFNGNRSASGEIFNQNALTAAHRSLPFGTRVKVTNMRTGRSVVVRINDRGPHIRGRIIDLSAAAARILGVMQTGTAPVRVEVMNKQSVPVRR